MKKLHRIALVPAATALAGASILLGAAPASAHVTVTGTSTAAGSSSVLTFSVGHGCDGSPTTKVAISIPEEILSVTPTRQPFYDVETVMVDLAEPATDAHGNEVTERVDRIVYTAETPLPDHTRDTFELSVSLPDAAGETIAFPTIQTCQKGETAWTEIAAEGQDSHDLEAPAPTMTLTAAEGDGHGHGEATGDSDAAAGESDADGAESQDANAEEESDGSGNGLSIAALVLGALGLLAGGAALARTRSTS